MKDITTKALELFPQTYPNRPKNEFSASEPCTFSGTFQVQVHFRVHSL